MFQKVVVEPHCERPLHRMGGGEVVVNLGHPAAEAFQLMREEKEERRDESVV